MFYTLSDAALSENMLSEMLISEIIKAIQYINAGEAPDEFPEGIDEENREIFQRSPGLIARFRAFVVALQEVNSAAREQVLAAITSQNNLPDILDGMTYFYSCRESQPKIQLLAADLFSFAFNKLTDLKLPGMNDVVRDWHYKIIFASLPKKCCPVCGIEKLEAPHPDIPRHDLDHYLAISRYPFAGVNLKNLTPMGDRCNKSYKRATDIMFDSGGNRRQSYFPYGSATAHITIAGSVLFGAEDGSHEWAVVLEPATAQSLNWNRVFEIQLRYLGILRTDVDQWVDQLCQYMKGHQVNLASKSSVLQGMQRFSVICEYESLPGIALLKRSVVDLIASELEGQPEGGRLHAFLQSAAAC